MRLKGPFFKSKTRPLNVLTSWITEDLPNKFLVKCIQIFSLFEVKVWKSTDFARQIFPEIKASEDSKTLNLNVSTNFNCRNPVFYLYHRYLVKGYISVLINDMRWLKMWLISSSSSCWGMDCQVQRWEQVPFTPQGNLPARGCRQMVKPEIPSKW